MYKRKRAGNTITRKINSTKIRLKKPTKTTTYRILYLEGFIPVDTEYFTASKFITEDIKICRLFSYRYSYCKNPPFLILGGFLQMSLKRFTNLEFFPRATVSKFISTIFKKSYIIDVELEPYSNSIS